MTEKEWLNCTDPTPMLEFLRGKVSHRKFCLFAIACCRRIWNLLDDERSRKAVAVVEDYTDGAGNDQDWREAREAAFAAYNASMAEQPDEEDMPKDFPPAPFGASPNAAAAAYFAMCITPASDYVHRALLASWYAALAVGYAGRPNDTWSETRRREYAVHCVLLRDIIGTPFWPGVQINSLDFLLSNSFRRVTIKPAWRSAKLVAIAKSIYEERRFSDLVILASALEDAGCDNQEILIHLRSPGPHVRGCHVLDLILGKD